ncbi:MAG: response regulator [Clostridiales bacterium]|jgi:two-component system response regulator YesN|nr:response regulator [Clostridiales bacterium]
MKLLIVDDEFFVRARIAQQVDWGAVGISEIREASDGLEALELIRDFAPDILLSDVCMPKMDGIRLAEAAAGLSAGCKVIFISGYSDAEYLKSAISLRALNYIEKPIDIRELTKALSDAVADIRKERSAAETLADLREKERAAALSRAALGLTSRASLAEALASLAGLADVAACKLFVTLIVHIAPAPAPSAGDEQPPEAETAAMLARAFETEGVTCLCARKRGEWIVHFMDRGSADPLRAYGYIERCCSLLSARALSPSEHRAIYGVGSFAATPEQAPASYEDALLAVQQGFFKRPGCVCYYKGGKKIYDFSSFSLPEFSHALKKGTPASAVFLARSVTAEIKCYENTLTANVLRFYCTLAQELLAAAKRDDIPLFDEFAWEQDIWAHMARIPFIDELCDFLIDGIERYYSAGEKGATPNQTVNGIIRYVKRHYGDPDLSITMISDYVKLSPTYICHLFKEVTGGTLNAFLTETRIRKSLDFIGDPRRKVKDVARLVGYRNGNYFSYQFKKYMGYSPTDPK